MTGVFAVVAWVAALNPPRTRLGLPATNDRARMGIVAPGVVLGLVLLLALAGGSDRVLEALAISPEMFRIAAGFVLLIEAAWMLFAPVPRDEPVAPGSWGALWPVAYPRVVTPATVALALTTGASDGVLVIPTLLAGATLLVLGGIRLGPIGRSVLAAVGRLLAVLLVLVAVWLAIEGVRQV